MGAIGFEQKGQVSGSLWLDLVGPDNFPESAPFGNGSGLVNVIESLICFHVALEISIVIIHINKTGKLLLINFLPSQLSQSSLYGMTVLSTGHIVGFGLTIR